MLKKTLFLLAFTCSCFSQTFYYANKPVINVFRQPNPLKEIGTQIIYGTEVEIIADEGTWIKIKTPYRFEGWCTKDQIIARYDKYPATEITAKVQSVWTHLYTVDDTTPHPIAYTLPFDAQVEVISSHDELHGRWMNVRLLDGTILFAIRKDFSFDSTPLTLSEMLSLSTQFLNIPYIWAGTSGFGFDCSGFTYTLFKQMDIFIPRNSNLQANFDKMIPIELENLLPGDLLFFGKTKIVHVGLYLGDETFIHAFAGNEDYPANIQISSLQEKKWSDELICIRRYASEGSAQIKPDNDPI